MASARAFAQPSPANWLHGAWKSKQRRVEFQGLRRNGGSANNKALKRNDTECNGILIGSRMASRRTEHISENETQLEGFHITRKKHFHREGTGFLAMSNA